MSTKPTQNKQESWGSCCNAAITRTFVLKNQCLFKTPVITYKIRSICSHYCNDMTNNKTVFLVPPSWQVGWTFIELISIQNHNVWKGPPVHEQLGTLSIVGFFFSNFRAYRTGVVVLDISVQMNTVKTALTESVKMFIRKLQRLVDFKLTIIGLTLAKTFSTECSISELICNRPQYSLLTSYICPYIEHEHDWPPALLAW